MHWLCLLILLFFTSDVFCSFSVSYRSSHDFTRSPQIPLRTSFCYLDVYDKLIYSWHEDDTRFAKTELRSFDGFGDDNSKVSLYDGSVLNYYTTQTSCDPSNDRLLRYSVFQAIASYGMEIRKYDYSTSDFILWNVGIEKRVTNSMFSTCRIFDSFFIGDWVFFLGHGDGPLYSDACGGYKSMILPHDFGASIFDLTDIYEDSELIRRIIPYGTYVIYGFYTDGYIARFDFSPPSFTKSLFLNLYLGQNDNRRIEILQDSNVLYVAYHSVNPTLIYRINLNDESDHYLVQSFSESKTILGMSIGGNDDDLLYIYEPREITKVRISDQKEYFSDYEITFPNEPIYEGIWSDFYIFKNEQTISSNPSNEAPYSVTINTLTSMYLMQSSDSIVYFYDLQYSTCDHGRYYSSISSEIGVCLDCDPGFTSYEDSNECEYCQNGQFRSHGTEECSDCPKGTWSIGRISDSDDCSDCPKGTYNPYTGQSLLSSCLPCPFGTYGSEEGLTESTSCSECPDDYTCPSGTSTPIPYVLSDSNNNNPNLQSVQMNVEYTHTDQEIEEEQSGSSSKHFEPLIVKSVMLVILLILGLLLALLLLCLYIPFPRIVCIGCCCCNLRSYDCFYNMAHDVEEGEPSFKMRTGIGGCFSVLALFLMVVFMGWSLYDFFFNNTSISRSTQLYFGNEQNSDDGGGDDDSGLKGDYFASVSVWGDFETCSNYSFASDGFNSESGEKYRCVKNGENSCDCSFECVECELSSRSIELTWKMNTEDQYVRFIQYSLTLPHYDEEENNKFEMKSSEYIIIPSEEEKMSSLVVDISLFRSTYRKIHGADFLTRIFDIPLVEESYGVVGSFQNVEVVSTQEDVVVDPFITIQMIGELSNFRYVIEESNSQTVLSLIGQSFALCGLSISLFGYCFGCAEGCVCFPCLSVKRHLEKLSKFIRKIVIKKYIFKGKRRRKDLRRFVKYTTKILGKREYRMKTDVYGLKNDMKEMKTKLRKLLQILNISEGELEELMEDEGKENLDGISEEEEGVSDDDDDHEMKEKMELEDEEGFGSSDESDEIEVETLTDSSETEPSQSDDGFSGSDE